MAVRVTGTGIVGELVCSLGGDIIIETERFGSRQVPASIVEVVPGGEDESVERDVVAAARLSNINEGKPDDHD